MMSCWQQGVRTCAPLVYRRFNSFFGNRSAALSILHTLVFKAMAFVSVFFGSFDAVPYAQYTHFLEVFMFTYGICTIHAST